MKLIIDIPDVEYNRIKEWEDNITGYQTSLALYRAVRDGKPYEERPQGEWITHEGYDGDEYYECSVCKDAFVLMEGTPKDNNYNFCPNCGADMRGKE